MCLFKSRKHFLQQMYLNNKKQKHSDYLIINTSIEFILKIE